MKFKRDKPLHSKEFRKKKEREKRIRIFVISSILIVILVLPVVMLRNKHFLIANVDVGGNTVTSDEDIKLIANDLIDGNYLWLIPRRNMLLYPKNKIEEIIRRKIPRLSGVELNIEDSVLKIIVDERSPESLYCLDISDLATPSGCFFLDDNGLIFSEAPYFSGDVYFIYTTSIPLNEPLGSALISPEEFKSLSNYIHELEHVGVHARAIVLDPENYNLVLANNGKIIWKKKDDLLAIRSNLEAFLLDPDTMEIKNFLDKVSYIDLRFENKVFYKLRD